MGANVQILRLITNPERVEAADPFHFMVEFTNQGDETTGVFPVRFELDGGADALEVDSPDVAPGGTDWAYWAHGGLREGNHSIYCRLDPGQTVLRGGGPHHEQTIYFEIHEIEFAPQDASGNEDYDEDALANAVATAILLRIGQWVSAADHAVNQWQKAADERVKDYIDAHTAPTLELDPFVEAIGEVILNHLPVVSEAKEMTEKVMAEFNMGGLIRAGIAGAYNAVNTAHERLNRAVEEIASATIDAIHRSVLGADGRVREYLSFKTNDGSGPLIGVEFGSLDPAYIGSLADWLGVPEPSEANTTQPIQDGMTHEFEVVLAMVDRQLNPS